MTTREILSRANSYLLFGILTVVVMHYARAVLIPLVFGAMFAMLTVPLCRYLEKKGFSRILSSLTGMLVVVSFLLFMFGVLAAQVNIFTEDLPTIKEKSNTLFAEAQHFIDRQFGVSPERQEEFLQGHFQRIGEAAGNFFAGIIGSLTSSIAGMVLMLVYTYLLLYNRERYQSFFLTVFRRKDPKRVKEVVEKVGHVSQHYLTGRAISVGILIVLYAIGLLLVGIKHAVLLACVAALLTVIPYVGTILGGLFPVLMALVTEDSFGPVVWAGGVMILIQAIDNYFIEPYVVGGEVNLSALSTILIIIVGGAVWGAAGMILFIPLLAMVKIICDNVDSLKPFGELIGDPDGGGGPSRIKQWFATRAASMKQQLKKMGS